MSEPVPDPSRGQGRRGTKKWQIGTSDSMVFYKSQALSCILKFPGNRFPMQIFWEFVSHIHTNCCTTFE